MPDTAVQQTSRPADERAYRERDLVLARRAAFETGVHAFYGQPEVHHTLSAVADRVAAQAATLYPLPKVVRPRVVPDIMNAGTQWCVLDGTLRQRVWQGPVHGWSDWQPFAGYLDRLSLAPLPGRVAMWLQLFDSPTIEVEDDA